MTYKIGNVSFLRYYFKILVKESNAYLQLIPAGGRLFCTGWTRSTKSLLQIMHADCMTYWKATEAWLGTYFTVALYCCFSMLMQLCRSAKNSNPASELLILQRCYWTANQSPERWWVWLCSFHSTFVDTFNLFYFPLTKKQTKTNKKPSPPNLCCTITKHKCMLSSHNVAYGSLFCLAQPDMYQSFSQHCPAGDSPVGFNNSIILQIGRECQFWLSWNAGRLFTTWD